MLLTWQGDPAQDVLNRKRAPSCCRGLFSWTDRQNLRWCNGAIRQLAGWDAVGGSLMTEGPQEGGQDWVFPTDNAAFQNGRLTKDFLLMSQFWRNTHLGKENLHKWTPDFWSNQQECWNYSLVSAWDYFSFESGRKGGHLICYGLKFFISWWTAPFSS